MKKLNVETIARTAREVYSTGTDACLAVEGVRSIAHALQITYYPEYMEGCFFWEEDLSDFYEAARPLFELVREVKSDPYGCDPAAFRTVVLAFGRVPKKVRDQDLVCLLMDTE